MTLTRARTIQYIGILFSLMLIAVGYWYFSVRAGVKSNTSALQPQGTGQLDSGLAGYWPLDNGSGTTATDLSTNGNNATLTNGPTWTTGQIGGAVDFDASDDHLSVPTPPYSNDALTMGAWVKIDATTATARAIYSANCFAYFVGWQLEAVENTGSASLLEVNFRLGNTSTVVANDALPIGQWTHIVATYSNSSTNIYINGRLVQSGSGTAALTGCGGEHYIGADPARFGANSNALSWDGALDEVRMYTRAFSSDEVGQLYRLTSPTSVDTSLKGYWSFNAQDMNGTTVFDRSGAGNTGTLTGGPTIDNGVSGQALNFDGSDDYVSAGTGASLENSVFTYSAWVKPTSVSGERAIVGGGSNAPRFTILSGNLHLVNTGIEVIGTSTSTVPTNVWSHVAVTYDGSGNYVFYLNGIVAGSGTNTTTFDFSSSTFLINGVAGNYLAGMIDEVRSYNRVLTAAEIKSLYDRVKPDGMNTSAGQKQGVGNLDSGLAAYLRLDETTGSTASDSSTNAASATLTNMENGDWVTGQIGNSLDFDGSNEYGTLPYSGALASNTGITYSFWVSPDLNDSEGILGSLNGEDGSAYNYIRIDNSGVEAGNPLVVMVRNIGGSTTSRSVQFTYPVSTWFHYTYTYDGAAERVYVNGSKLGEWSQTGNFATNTEYGLLLGGDYTGGNYFDGRLDEVRVYNRALSGDEVGALYRLVTPTAVDTGLKGYWSFNGQDMNGTTTAYDRSGAGNTGILTSGPAIARGVSGQALNFDGSNDYVSVSDPGTSSNLDLANGDSITITAWVRPESFPSYGTILTKSRTDGGAGNNYSIRTGNGSGNTQKFAYQYRNSGNTAWHIYQTNTDVFQANQWYHVAATYTAGTGSSMKLYVNGDLFSGTWTTNDGNEAPYQDNSQLWIGRDGNGESFDGSIDEARIYKRILSAAEIKSLYDTAAPDKTNTSVSQAQGTGRLDSGLAGYWPLDETTGSSAADTSTNGYTGTLQSMENGDWVTGRIGNGLTFDGTNEYVSTGIYAPFQFANQTFTVSGWFNKNNLTSPAYVIAQGGCTGGWLVRLDGGTLTAAVRGSGSCGSVPVTRSSASTGLNDGSWHHFAAVITTSTTTNSAHSISIYIDGALNQGTLTLDGSSVYLPVTSPLTIASRDGGLDQPFHGSLDEMRVYNRGLSADEVANLYRLGTPTGTDTSLKGYWSFNGQDMTATTAFDRSGSAINGTLAGNTSITRGKLGQALSFDGSGDYINLGNTLELGLPMTVSAWINLSAYPPAVGGIITTDKSGDQYHTGMWFQVNSTGVLGVNYGDNTSCTSSGRRSYTGTRVLALNTWYHVTTIVSGPTDMKLYIDGMEDTGTYTGEGGAIAYDTHNATIGQVTDCPGGGGFDFPGKLDEVRIYNRALSPTEVQTMYKQNK